MSKSPPKILYKYRGMNEFTKKILSHGKIYFSKLTELNDPFEYFFYFTEGTSCPLSEKDAQSLNAEYLQELNIYKLTPEQNTQRFILSLKKRNHGMFCLSECHKIRYMYAHYADSFKGICIGFSSAIFSNLNKLRKMRYEDEPYKVSSDNVSTTELEEIFCRKSKTFVDEKEWRVIDSYYGVLSDGCDLLVIEQDRLNSIDYSEFPANFRSGYIYNISANDTDTKFWYFDREKKNPLMSLNFHGWINKESLGITDDTKNEVTKLIRAIENKPRFPKITSFSNLELQLLEKIPLTMGEKLHNKPIFLDPKNIRENIREIIFGFNISQNDVNEVLELTKDISVEFKVARPVIGSDGYHLEIIPFNNYQSDIKRFREIYGYL